MSVKNNAKYSVHAIINSGLEYLTVKESTDSLDSLQEYEVRGHAYDGSRVEFVYASHKSEALSALDNIINTLQALRQDLDLAYKD